MSKRGGIGYARLGTTSPITCAISNANLSNLPVVLGSKGSVLKLAFGSGLSLKRNCG